MSPSSASGSQDKQEPGLPWHDWILLPVIGLCAVSLLAASMELLTRYLFPVSEIGMENCFVMSDPTGDALARPNSVCTERIAESHFVAEYRFNRWGHRADTELGPKPPNFLPFLP